MAGPKPNTPFSPAAMVQATLAGAGKAIGGLGSGVAQRLRSFSAAPGKLLWPLAVGAGVLIAFYLGARALFGLGPDAIPNPSLEPTGDASWVFPMAGGMGDASWRGWLTKASFVVMALAMLAACAWFVDWMRTQRFAPRVATILKVLLALTPLSIGQIASLDGVYQPMQEPLQSYLLLIASPFAAAGVLVAFDRRRVWWLTPLALLSPAGLALGAGALGAGLDEAVQHLRGQLSTLAPDQRMWWLALAITPAAVFAAVATIADAPARRSNESLA
jgi:hypothetical protein